MELLENKTEDVGYEKACPGRGKKQTMGSKIKIGSVPSSDGRKSYIEWIEAVWDSRTYIKFLNPGEASEAEFRDSPRWKF